MKNSQKITKEDLFAMMEAVNKTSLVSITDAKGDIIYANDKFVEISKYSQDELLGQNHRILKSGDQPDEIFIDLWKTISNNQIWRGEIKNRAKDGSHYWVDTSIAPILDINSKIEKYIAVRFLINDKKEIEESLQKRMDDAERINKMMVNRELKMIELKKEIVKLYEDCV